MGIKIQRIILNGTMAIILGFISPVEAYNGVVQGRPKDRDVLKCDRLYLARLGRKSFVSARRLKLNKHPDHIIRARKKINPRHTLHRRKFRNPHKNSKVVTFNSNTKLKLRRQLRNKFSALRFR